MTATKRFRLRVVMRFARLLGVPVDVHNSYFGTFNKPAWSAIEPGKTYTVSVGGGGPMNGESSRG